MGENPLTQCNYRARWVALFVLFHIIVIALEIMNKSQVPAKPNRPNNNGRRKAAVRTPPVPRPPRVPRAPKQPRVAPATVHAVCGLTDPFCDASVGAKLPDGSSMRTMPYRIHFVKTLTTDASGNVGQLILPNVYQSPAVTGSIVGTVFTAAAMGAAVVALPAGVTRYRMISCGYVLRNICAPLNAQGVVELRTFSTAGGGSLAAIDLVTYMCANSATFALQDCHSHSTIIAHTAQRAADFYAPLETTPTTAVTAWVAPGFCPSSIGVIGGPASTAVLRLEIIMNVEYVFADDEPMALATTPSPPYSPTLTAAAARVQSFGNLVYHRTTEAAAKYVESKAIAALSTILGPVGRLAAGMGQLALTVD